MSLPFVLGFSGKVPYMGNLNTSPLSFPKFGRRGGGDI